MAGPALGEKHSSRGAAFGDFDNNGSIDIVIWNRNEPPSLLRNSLKLGNHWLEVTLVGTRSNRSAIGALVTVEFGGHRQVQVVLSQSSFTSASDLRLHFGLSSATTAKINVRWPSGLVETFEAAKVDQAIQLTEGR